MKNKGREWWWIIGRSINLIPPSRGSSINCHQNNSTNYSRPHAIWVSIKKKNTKHTSSSLPLSITPRKKKFFNKTHTYEIKKYFPRGRMPEDGISGRSAVQTQKAPVECSRNIATAVCHIRLVSFTPMNFFFQRFLLRDPISDEICGPRY